MFWLFHVFVFSRCLDVQCLHLVWWPYIKAILIFRWKYSFWGPLNLNKLFLDNFYTLYPWIALASKPLNIFWPNMYFGSIYMHEEWVWNNLKISPHFGQTSKNHFLIFYKNGLNITVLVTFLSKIGTQILYGLKAV